MKIKKKITKDQEFERAWDLKINYLLIDDYTQSHLIDNNRRHPYHIVENSPWPFRLAMALFFTIIGFVFYMNNLKWGGPLFLLALFQTFKFLYLWFNDVIDEGTFSGHHTVRVQKLLKWGMALFILSEVMFFFGFFWAFFHSSLSPSIWIGSLWPPRGIVVPLSTGIPLLNTFILIFSGITVTYTQVSLQLDKPKSVILGFSMTLVYAFVFLMFQLFEYFHLSFSINDSIYGTTFFMLTGFHGLHVIIGSIFLVVCFLRFLSGHFNSDRHLGLDFAAWYWHFVDVVWLFLFIFIYVWGGWQIETLTIQGQMNIINSIINNMSL